MEKQFVLRGGKGGTGYRGLMEDAGLRPVGHGSITSVLSALAAF